MIGLIINMPVKSPCEGVLLMDRQDGSRYFIHDSVLRDSMKEELEPPSFADNPVDNEWFPSIW